MKKSLLLASLFALCALLVAGSFSDVGYAKGTKKKTAQVEKKAAEAPVSSKETSSSTKSDAATSTKTNTATTVKKVTASPLGAIETLFRAAGTSRAEIDAMIKQASNPANASSPAAGEGIDWQVLSGGGGSGSSTNFGLVSVIGQTAVGVGTSASFSINHGFLQDFGGGSCCVAAGDYNDDGSFNIADVTAGIARIFNGGVAPICQDQADANGDNSFNIADVTYGIARIFNGGPAPICGTTGV